MTTSRVDSMAEQKRCGHLEDSASRRFPILPETDDAFLLSVIRATVVFYLSSAKEFTLSGQVKALRASNNQPATLFCPCPCFGGAEAMTGSARTCVE